MAEISDILTELIDRTGRNKVNWQPTSDEQTFLASLGTASVMILEDQAGDAVLRILNLEGQEIERLDSGIEGEGRTWRNELRELYIMAKRVALGVDSQLEDLLQELRADS